MMYLSVYNLHITINGYGFWIWLRLHLMNPYFLNPTCLGLGLGFLDPDPTKICSLDLFKTAELVLNSTQCTTQT